MKVFDVPSYQATLTLDHFDSGGRQGRVIKVETERALSAVRVGGGAKPLWFGFVVTSAPVDVLLPGSTTEVEIAFLDSAGAVASFPAGASVLFGDMKFTRGTFKFSMSDGSLPPVPWAEREYLPQ